MSSILLAQCFGGKLLRVKIFEFYQTLAPIKSFAKATNLSYYQSLPEDWYILIADVEGSTKAIEAGRYRDVNLIGAACVAAVQNKIGSRDFPFCFGGDGATLLIPPELKDSASEALQNLQVHSEKTFGLKLRVGIIRNSEITSSGKKVLVAKYELTPGNFHALIQGGGLEYAESIIKSSHPSQGFILKSPDTLTSPNLDSLSCRWSPIDSARGQIVSVIVLARDHLKAPRIYDQILSEIHPLFDHDTNRPLAESNLKLDSLFSSIAKEWKLRKDLSFSKKIWKILIPQLWTRMALKKPLDTSMQQFNQTYRSDTVKNSDYKKIDDVLRMVLDCDNQQAEKLETVLKHHFDLGEIFFGIFKSKQALMTCLVMGTEQNQHIHFIDGADGGYAMAAKSLKQQKAAQS